MKARQAQQFDVYAGSAEGNEVIYISQLQTEHERPDIISLHPEQDSDFTVKIAVIINGDDQIVGKLEYSNHKPQYPLQLVTFNQIADTIYAEPYLFEIAERTIVSPGLHRIKCVSVNDKYGAGSVILGTIDFRNELKPKINMANEGGYAYLSNITGKGRETQKKYIPNVWLGN